ncbi:MAG: calcium-binding protein [Deltaproteobacteria bacterium]|nr:calcium-binding protein [Deltaproteobacteria bacterium]
MGKKTILIEHTSLFLRRLCALIIIGALLVFPDFSYTADETVCAQVKIEIRQELTLERQGFDAHMRINNGLSHITLQDVDVDVSFTDEEGNSVLASSDPANTDALFYIRVDSMDNIENIEGSGTVDPSSASDIHWLIIPAPGSSNGLKSGTLYYVGATLTYTIGGEENVTEVSPDYIYVKPMPELALDYFIPTDVYGDDAFSTEIEPPIPFSLGVRVKNNGLGVARNLKIDSAQPKIIENEQGLLIGFSIQGSEVDGQPATDSLLVNFGDIDPNTSGMARWIMTCTLSGQFVEFTAEFSHSDELGGELTSLLEGVNTHFLVRDALVDLPGRDSIRDLLAIDGDVYRVYESDSADTVVLDQSASSTLQFEGQNGSQIYYTLSTPITAGFLYVKLSDPYSGQKMIAEAHRSDGKLIKSENVWLSKSRNGQNWNYFINLFDANTTGAYTIKFDDVAFLPQPPVLQFIPDRTRSEGHQLSFIVEASDPNGTTPMLSAAPLPAGADFTDQENGMGVFDWTPGEGQAGTYTITFKASDGTLEDSQQVLITITSGDDSDNDGIPDDWEMQYFGSLDRDGTGDFDGDGISDLDEYLNGTDPASSNAPSIPNIVSPQDAFEITDLQPTLVIANSTDPDSDAVTYAFEVYENEAMINLVAGQSDVSEGTENTSWTVSQELNDNTWYYWRVRASDGIGSSAWAYGSFFVNTANDPPNAFNISSPGDGSEVDTVTPVLEVTNSVDVDGDELMYTFKVYADSGLSILVASGENIPEGTSGSTSWTVESPLDDNTWYFWQAITTDEHGATAESLPASFFVNTANDAPLAPVISSPVHESEVDVQDLDLTAGNAQDVDEDQLTYFFELDTVNTFDSPDKQTSGEITEGADFTTWQVFGLDDNTTYFWRVKASDGFAQSPWAQGNFFVNTANDAPSPPTLKNPGQGAWVATITPTLELNASQDLDNDQISYEFEVYADEAMDQQVATGVSGSPEWVVSVELSDNTWYYWRARAQDEHGAVSEWMEMASLFTDSNGIDDPPTIVIQEPSEDLITEFDNIQIGWEDSDPETDADIALYYDTDAFGEDGTLIVAGLTENPDGEDGDSYLWDITSVAEGTYYVYGAITDGNSSAVSYALVAVTIARPPEVEIVSPEPDHALQDGVTFAAVASDDTEVAEVYFYLREQDGGSGIPIGYENLASVFNETTGWWETDFETTQIPDGYYVLLAKAVDVYGNEGWSDVVSFSIRNWAVIELLPATENNNAGRTMPVKFALRIAPEVDPTMPFVYNEELEIRIYNQEKPSQILQAAFFGDTSKDYRISIDTEHYITNFKTSKKPAVYMVEIWRISNNFLVGSFSFETF